MRWRVAVDLEGGPVGYEELSALAHQLAGRAVCVSALPDGHRLWVTLDQDGLLDSVVEQAVGEVLDALTVVGIPSAWRVAGTEVLALPQHARA
jgi:hypothetical protein